jgi:hypothetical protein
MPTAAPPAQFGARYGKNLDTCGFKGGIGIVVSVITDDDARTQGQNIVSVVPLFA